MLRKTQWPVETSLQMKLYGPQQEPERTTPIRLADRTDLVISKRHKEEEEEEEEEKEDDDKRVTCLSTPQVQV